MFVEPYLATVTIFAGNFAPRGWMFCQGQSLPIASNDALFSLLGTTYGGDGQATFNLPNLAGRRPVHPGSGTGLSTITLGETGGSEAISLTVLNIAPHNHPFVTATGSPVASTGAANQNDPTNHAPAVLSGQSAYNTATSGNVMAASHSIANTPPSVGGNAPVDILSPYLAMNYIICVEGIYPSRN